MSSAVTTPSLVEAEGMVLVIPGTGSTTPAYAITASEYSALVARIKAQEEKTLGDLSNVTEGGRVEGAVLKVLADGTWGPGNQPGVIDRVSTNWNGNAVDMAKLISLGRGLDVDTQFSSTQRAHIVLVFGGTGTAVTPSRSDHVHSATKLPRYKILTSGALSTGSRTLISDIIAGLDPTVTYDIEFEAWVFARNTVNSGEVLMTITVDGATTSETLTPRTVGGVPEPLILAVSKENVTGKSSVAVTFTASVVAGGDPTDFMTGMGIARAHPRR